MILQAQIFRVAPEESRDADRFSANVGATLRAGDNVPLDVHIHDLSQTGFAMETGEELGRGQTIWIGLTGAGVNAARVVRRLPGGWGCQFEQPISEPALRAALRARSTVVSTPWAELQAGGETEPVIARWPVHARIAFIIGSSLALWAAIFWIFS